MIKLSESHDIQDFIKFSALQRFMFDDDFLIAISDTKKLLWYQPGEKIKLPIKVGEDIKPTWSLSQCMEQKKTLNVVIGKEVMGTAYRSIANPIYDSKGEIIGAVAIARDVNIKSDLIDLSGNISNSLAEMNLATVQMTRIAENLLCSQNSINTASKETAKNVQDIYQMIDFIKSIAHKTNMLGINASIEAARAGQEGKGFAIVAEEIRKLSIESNSAVSKIETVLKLSNSSMNTIVDEIEKNQGSIETQASSLEEFNASIEDLNSISSKLVELSKSI